MRRRSVFPNAEGWSPRRVDLLRKHHALGLSAARSAELLGDVSRNAVISKRSRLGLNSVRSPADTECNRQLFAQGRLRLIRPPALRCEPLPNMEFELPPGAVPKRLCNRGLAECAWPLGVADAEGDHLTRFCCAPVDGLGSYCASHAAIARRRP
jgi:hypothetical protein